MQPLEADRREYEAFRWAVRSHGQAAMAKAMGVSPAYICDLVNQKRKLKGKHIQQMGAILKTPDDQIAAVNRHCARLAGYNV